MKLIVGLGNPGQEYRETRHNVGFMVVDALVTRWRVADEWREKFEALQIKTTVAGEPVIVSKPLTFMNLSGQSVAATAGFYKIEPADVFIVTDDVALPLGRLRARRDGSAGGHNGLKSIIQHLGTQAFPRMRVGVGGGGGGRDQGGPGVGGGGGAGRRRSPPFESRAGTLRRVRARHGFGGGAARRRCVGHVSVRRNRASDELVQRS